MQEKTSLRPNWDEYFMLIAKLVSSRSTCNSRPTGAVIVKDRQILATGYNGALSGEPHCINQIGTKHELYCRRRELDINDLNKYAHCVSNHAEANAIAQAAKHGILINNADLYCTMKPCAVCAKLIQAAGITRVFYEYQYDSAPELNDHMSQITIKIETLEYVLPMLTTITSKRRLERTL